jgi:hypothetical protein
VNGARPPEGVRPLRLRRGEAQHEVRSLGEVAGNAARPPEGVRPLRLRRGEAQHEVRSLGEVAE